ncbi:fumarate reductase/succinate dehydrogenase flavoprotein, C-terminal domain protein, partial [Bordetella bronchiseptica MBORD591]
RAATLPGALALLQTERMARCAAMVVAAALTRTESRGAHQRRDFPQQDPRWLAHLAFQRDRGAAPFIAPIH